MVNTLTQQIIDAVAHVAETHAKSAVTPEDVQRLYAETAVQLNVLQAELNRRRHDQKVTLTPQIAPDSALDIDQHPEILHEGALQEGGDSVLFMQTEADTSGSDVHT
jgi:hypothetical protein